MKATTIQTVLFALACMTIGAASRANTWYLPSGTADQTAQLQAIINGAAPYDTIVLQSGTHYFNGLVTQPIDHLTFTGASGSQMLKIAGDSQPLLDGRGNYCTYSNIYIDGANGPQPDMRLYGSWCQVLNSTFRNSGNTGLLVNTSNYDTFQGDFCYYNGVAGISQWDSANNTVQSCQLHDNNGEGLTIDGGSNNCQVFGNWVHHNNWGNAGVGGIGIDGSNGADIYNNTIDYNALNGITLENNLPGGCNGVNVHDNPNISYNQNWACYRNTRQPNNNFGWTNNTCVGNGVGVLF
jgi:parallel beta-helix repeat protein